MKIQKYRFGKITIDNQAFTSDVLLDADKIHPNWRRKHGHALVMADIELLLDQIKPDIFIMGTGYFGRVKIDDAVHRQLAKRQIELISAKSSEAVQLFNTLSGKKRVLAGFHLTC